MPLTVSENALVVHGDKLGTELACCCCGPCAASCDQTVTIHVEWCGMEVDITLPIPGSSGFVEDTSPPDENSYLIVDALIGCGSCGFNLIISVCAACTDTSEFASDSFTAFIPFAATEEPEGGFCPQSGEIELVCFGDQFGFPCKTTATATIS